MLFKRAIASALCPSKTLLKVPRPTPTQPTPTASSPFARAEAVGGGWVAGVRALLKRVFSKSLRASHRWVAVAGCQAASLTHRALKALCGG